MNVPSIDIDVADYHDDSSQIHQSLNADLMLAKHEAAIQRDIRMEKARLDWTEDYQGCVTELFNSWTHDKQKLMYVKLAAFSDANDFLTHKAELLTEYIELKANQS